MRSYGYDIEHIGGKTEYLSTCPFCLKEKHFGINPSRGSAACFRCHKGTRFINLIMKVSGKTYIETLEFLKSGVDDKRIDLKYIGDVLKEFKSIEDIESKIRPIALPPGYTSLHNKETDYTKKRKLTQEQINYYKIGMCYEGKYKDRLIVCDVNDRQEVIYWVARDTTGLVPKRWKCVNPNTEDVGVGSGDLLFNWYLTRNYPCAIITEGVFDALWIGNNGMATYGTGIKRNHMYWMLRAGFQEVILLYDADVKDDELEKSATQLAQFFPTYICKLPKGDPDEYSKEGLQFLLSTEW